MFTVAVSAAAIYLYNKYFPTIKQWYDESMQTVASSALEDFRNNETSYIYDNAGNVLLKLKQDKDVQYVEYEELPENIVRAFVAIEDKRFYQHHGVDWASTAKAAWLLLRNDGNITRGGSTITQQLARNIYLSFETSYERKVREIFIALGLEKKYSKNQILEFYINNINFANGYVGIGAAAKGYFGKSIKELSVGEAAFLCAIPNNPTYYNPVKNFENTIYRRNLILREMYNQGYLSEKEYQRACNAAVHLEESTTEYNDYAASFALDCTIRQLMKSNGFHFEYSWASTNDYEVYLDLYAESYSKAEMMLRTGGYRVYTSIDVETQNALQEIFDEGLSSFTETKDDGSFVMQGAATIVDNKTGRVIATIGGRTCEGDHYLVLNRAFQSYKQPGSTIKPLLVYTPVLEKGYTADSIVKDVPIADGPSNSNGKYSGNITLRSAVEQSKNVVAWQLFSELTPSVGLGYLQEMHFAKLVPDDYYLPAVLGGLTYGVTTTEMAGGYSALENDGIWREPTCVERIVSVDNEELFSGAESKRVYVKEAADAMTDILLGVSKVGTAAGLALKGGHEFACKTGTTNDNKAAWFCGYTKQYSIAVYVGADENATSVKGLWGSTYPARIWCAMQNYLLDGEEPQSLLSEDDLNGIKAYVSPEKLLEQEFPVDEESESTATGNQQLPGDAQQDEVPEPESVPGAESEPTSESVSETVQKPVPNPEPESETGPGSVSTEEEEPTEKPVEPEQDTENPEPEPPTDVTSGEGVT